jgi:hypothetical protein
MLRKLTVSFSTVAVMVVSAATYNVPVFQNARLDGKNLRAGDYRMEIKDNNVVLKHDRDVIEVAARTETADKKFAQTVIRFNSKNEVTEICVGGTNKRLVFAGTGENSSGM